jgi:hypothetical protein
VTGLAVHLLGQCVDPSELRRVLTAMDSVLAEWLADRLLGRYRSDAYDWTGGVHREPTQRSLVSRLVSLFVSQSAQTGSVWELVLDVSEMVLDAPYAALGIGT